MKSYNAGCQKFFAVSLVSTCSCEGPNCIQDVAVAECLDWNGTQLKNKPSLWNRAGGMNTWENGCFLEYKL